MKRLACPVLVHCSFLISHDGELGMPEIVYSTQGSCFEFSTLESSFMK